MKTIFYIESEDEKGDYWFENKPYKQVLSYDNIIYQCDGNVRKIIEIKNANVTDVNAVININFVIDFDNFKFVLFNLLNN